MNINTLLLSIRLLLAHPNAEDGLVPDITEEYKRSYATYRSKAVEFTRLYAAPASSVPSTSQPAVVKESTVEVTAGQEKSVIVAGTSSESSSNGAGSSAVGWCVPEHKERHEITYAERVIYEAEGYVLLGCQPRAVSHLRDVLSAAGADAGSEQTQCPASDGSTGGEHHRDGSHSAGYRGSPEKRIRII